MKFMHFLWLFLMIFLGNASCATGPKVIIKDVTGDPINCKIGDEKYFDGKKHVCNLLTIKTFCIAKYECTETEDKPCCKYETGEEISCQGFPRKECKSYDWVCHCEWEIDCYPQKGCKYLSFFSPPLRCDCIGEKKFILTESGYEEKNKGFCMTETTMASWIESK